MGTGEGPGLLSSGAASGHTLGSPGLSGRLSEGGSPAVRLLCQRRASTTFLTELRMSMVLADMGLLAQRHREAWRWRPRAPRSPGPAHVCGGPPLQRAEPAPHTCPWAPETGVQPCGQRGAWTAGLRWRPRCLFLGQQELELFPSSEPVTEEK